MTNADKSFTDKLIKFLGSLKFSFPLILILGALVAQKAIIAQKAVMPREGTEPNLLIKRHSTPLALPRLRLSIFSYIVCSRFL